jgi:hypothetical protein
LATRATSFRNRIAACGERDRQLVAGSAGCAIDDQPHGGEDCLPEYAIVTHPVLVGGGTPFFTALDNWVNLRLVETRTFPDGVLLTRYETRR